MIDLQRVAACVLIAVALPAAAEMRRTPFTHFGAPSALALRGDGGAAAVEFGSRSDELVTRARLHLRYTYSPELASASHIRVSLNDDLVGLLPVTRADAGKPVARALDVDPRLVIGFNKLTLTLVATPGDDPPDAARPGLWAEVSGASEWEIVVQTLTLADDLAILPEPFFDRHDQRRVTVPFVFAARPSEATLRAAAVAASWLGKLARWRGARFPASLDAPAEGHAIAFAANDERPAFLASLPPATGPQLRFVTNPADNRSKLLLVLGRNGEDLKAAVDALALGGAKWSGPSVDVKRVAEAAPRAPYDAPDWVRLDRAVKLGDLIEWPQQLEATGRLPDLEPVRVDLRVPPDIAAWRGPGVPMVLKLQYTPNACVTDGQLDLSLNDEVVQSITLPIAPKAITETREIFLAGYRLRGRSELKFAFHFALKDEPQCREPRPGRAVVASDSTIDFSGFPHYARLPNLAHFAALGFPFTRVADLSQTVVVLPDPPAAADLEAMLSLIGRMGEATGYPATRVRVAGAKDVAALADADLLVIGSAPRQALLERWADAMPVSISGTSRRASPAMARGVSVRDWLGLGAPPETGVASQVSFGGTGPVAAMFGFESPVTSGRSVVVVTAVVPDQLARALEALEGSDMRRAIRGSAAFVVDGKVESILVGPTYHLGFMPPWTGLGRWLVEHPIVLASVLAFVALVVYYIVTRIRRRMRAWRIHRRAA